MKVYHITTDLSDKTIGEILGNTAKLDAEIQKLAKAGGDEVYLHQFVSPVGGAPCVLLECSESFLEKVKRLPLFDSVHVLDSRIETARRTSAPQIEPPEAMKRKISGPKGL
jgi:hypothetical protein